MEICLFVGPIDSYNYIKSKVLKFGHKHSPYDYLIAGFQVLEKNTPKTAYFPNLPLGCLIFMFSLKSTIIIFKTTAIYRAFIAFISSYVNTKMSVCLSICSFAFFQAISKPIGIQFGTKWLFWPRKGSKTTIFKKLFLAELLPLFYISLRFLCKFEERLQKNPKEVGI